MKLKKIAVSLGLAFLAATGASVAQAAPYANVVAIVDESGSMAGEHAWLGGMMNALDAGLVGRGLTPNQFGLVGFGGNSSHGIAGHSHLVGGGEFGTSAEFATATGSLIVSGGTEDGYSGIALANSYTYRAGTARNYILVTDEDRDILTGSPHTYTSMLASMTSTQTLLNAVVNASFRCGDGLTALGMTAGNVGYRVGANGTFTTCAGATAVSGFGTTLTNYVNLALATGGAAWDLNQLRAGGNTALSFTNAFVDLKVEEIVSQPVPEPGTMALAGLALLGLAAARRRRV